MKKYAVIVAGGSGKRMNGTIPKQFLLLHQKPILWHSIEAFRNTYADIHIIVVVPQAQIDNPVIQQLRELPIEITSGGDTRFHSVRNGLQLVPNDVVVFVHDGVRCLLTKDLVIRCCEETLKTGSAIPVVGATDSLRIINDGSHAVINRDHIRVVQTPQTFLSTDLKAAFNQPFSDAFTDEATVMEAFGKTITLVEGEYENIKITRPLDLLLAESILKNRAIENDQ